MGASDERELPCLTWSYTKKRKPERGGKQEEKKGGRVRRRRRENETSITSLQYSERKA